MIKYYITDDAAKVTFTLGPTVVVFNIKMEYWKHLLSSDAYVEHHENNMVASNKFLLRTWTEENGKRYLFFKYFESSIHTPLSLEMDQNLYYFFESINKIHE